MGAILPQTPVAHPARGMLRRGLSLTLSAAEEAQQPAQQSYQKTLGGDPAAASPSPGSISLIRPAPPSESKARLILWLLMIRSRLRRLGALVVWDRYHSNRFAIARPHSPVDRVLRAWMEGVVAAEVGSSGDQQATELLRALIDLLLYEAREECDYRRLFPLLGRRITAHVLRLLQDASPLLVGEVVFADRVATMVNVCLENGEGRGEMSLLRSGGGV